MTEDTTLRIERVIDASIEAVWAALTTKDAMERWYEDGDGFVARVTELDLRVGGRYRVEFGPTGEDPYVEYGEYLELDPPHRGVWTETLEGVPEPWSDTTVTVELRDEGGKTALTLTHVGFPSAHHRSLAEGGWPGFLERLETVATGTT